MYNGDWSSISAKSVCAFLQSLKLLALKYYYDQLINKTAVVWGFHLTSLPHLLYTKPWNTKTNDSQSLPLGYMVAYPVWSACGLKYGKEKYAYSFVDMDMDLPSAHTLNTELSLSTTQKLGTMHSFTEPVPMVTYVKWKRVFEVDSLSGRVRI